jgi:hypothetical protein
VGGLLRGSLQISNNFNVLSHFFNNGGQTRLTVYNVTKWIKCNLAVRSYFLMDNLQISDRLNDAFVAFNREASRHADNTYVAQLGSDGAVVVIAIPYGDPDKPYRIPQELSTLISAVGKKAYAAETGAFIELKQIEKQIAQAGIEDAGHQQAD